MRNFFEVYIDVKDGKDVDKEELRVALMMARDLLFFAEEDNENLIKCIKDGKGQAFTSNFVEKNMKNRIQVRKNPMEKWWGSVEKIPK